MHNQTKPPSSSSCSRWQKRKNNQIIHLNSNIYVLSLVTGLSSIASSTGLQNHGNAYSTTSPMYIIPNTNNVVSTGNLVHGSTSGNVSKTNSGGDTNSTSTSLTSGMVTNRISSSATVSGPSVSLHSHKRNGDLVAMSQLSATEIQKSHNLSAPSIGGDDTSLADNNLLDEMHKGSMYFGTRNASEVTTQRGTTAYLPCSIHFLHGGGMVSTLPEERKWKLHFRFFSSRFLSNVCWLKGNVVVFFSMRFTCFK